MKDGLYRVQFSLGPKDGRNGVGVIAGDELLGGDNSHWWRGRIRQGEDGSVAIELTITSHSPGGDKVFGFFDTFDLSLTGRMRGEVAQLVGATVMAPDRQINMNLRPLHLADEAPATAS
jgi:hypothetical protein